MSKKSTRLKELGLLNPCPQQVQADWFQIDTFFDPNDIVQVKYEMLRLVQHEGASKKEAAAKFGVSRPTFYQTEEAFATDGLAGLIPQKRGPKGAHKLDAQLMDFIELHQQEHGRVSAARLATLIQKKFGITVHQRSIERAIIRKKKL